MCNFFRSDPESGHALVRVRSEALCHIRTDGFRTDRMLHRRARDMRIPTLKMHNSSTILTVASGWHVCGRPHRAGGPAIKFIDSAKSGRLARCLGGRWLERLRPPQRLQSGLIERRVSRSAGDCKAGIML